MYLTFSRSRKGSSTPGKKQCLLSNSAPEQAVIRHTSSCYVIGRSGTGCVYWSLSIMLRAYRSSKENNHDVVQDAWHWKNIRTFSRFCTQNPPNVRDALEGTYRTGGTLLFEVDGITGHGCEIPWRAEADCKKASPGSPEIDKWRRWYYLAVWSSRKVQRAFGASFPPFHHFRPCTFSIASSFSLTPRLTSVYSFAHYWRRITNI